MSALPLPNASVRSHLDHATGGTPVPPSTAASYFIKTPVGPPPGNERFHTDLASCVAGLDPVREAALVLTLLAGAYTAIVETPNGTPGVGIVEIYRIN